MWRYGWDFIIESSCKDIENKEKVRDILLSVPDTDLYFPETKTMEDAITEIREIGEDKIADLLSNPHRII